MKLRQLLIPLACCLVLGVPVAAQKDKNEKLRVTVRAIAYRIIPWQSTTYYTTPGSASTSCYGQGTWWGYGSFGTLNMNTDCNTTYTNPTQIPITWYKVDIYNLVETDTHNIVIGCRANWRWSKCSRLTPDDVFDAEIEGGKLFIIGYKDRERKKPIRVKYDIVEINPKHKQEEVNPIPPRAQERAQSSAEVAEVVGTLTVTSTPDNAELFVDGGFVGNAPATLKLSPGKYTIRVVLPGHKEWTRNISVTAGSELKLVASLEKSN